MARQLAHRKRQLNEETGNTENPGWAGMLRYDDNASCGIRYLMLRLRHGCLTLLDLKEVRYEPPS